MSTKKSSKKYITQKIGDNVQFITLANNPKPVVKKDASKGILKHGYKNDYPDYLIWLFENSPSHGAVVKGKARYLSGLNIKPKEEDQNASDWLKKINAHGLIKKVDLDECISGNEYVLVGSNIVGTPLTFKHLEFAKCRIGEFYDTVEYSEDWNDTRNNPIQCYPIWKSGTVEPSVMVYKTYSPTAKKIDGAYGKPEYNSCIVDVDTDIEVNTFFNSLVKNGFSAGNIITIFSGKIPKEKQDEIKAGIVEEGEGSMNAGKTIFSFANEGAKGAEVASLNSNDLDKQYQEVSKRNLQNVLIGHGVSAVLFKLQTPGTLGQRNELIESHELFLNEYVKPKQERRLKWLSEMYKLRTGLEVEFEFEQVQDIGIDFADPNVSKYLTNDEMREKLGLTKVEATAKTPSQLISDSLNAMSPLLATKVLESMSEDEIRSLANLPPKTVKPTNPNGSPIVQEEAAPVNEVLKNLTGRQMQGLMRIVNKYDKKQLSKEQASMLMQQGFGVTEEQAKTLLMIADEDEETADEQIHQCSHIHLSRQEDKFFSLFTKYAHDVNLSDEILETRFIDADKVNMAVAVKSLDKLTNPVLDAIKENEKVSVKELAKKLGAKEEEIKSTIDWLKEKNLIKDSTYGFSPTKKALAEPTYKTEIYTEYTYELRPELKGQPILLNTSHEFCFKMVKLTRNKALSFEAINSMTNNFGENAFDFRGGFTMRKGGTKIDPWCRHIWMAQTKIRRVKI